MNSLPWIKLFVALALAGLQAKTASALTIETVPVGNPGNAPDPFTSRGAVAYEYRIGKYEVTLTQYTEFLNAVAATDTYGLWNSNMAVFPTVEGIARGGAPGSYTYSVIGGGNRPVTLVDWFDAARFANWLQNGQPTGLQEAGTTETGAYTLTGNTGIIPRNTNWIYGLPTDNEWYKAAYHHPAAQGGDIDNYWAFPTRSNSNPNSRNGSGTDPNSANCYFDDGIANDYNGGFAVSNSLAFPSSNALTDAGAFSAASSYYGTFDQAGNVWEWTDATISGTWRVWRGGSWAISDWHFLRSDYFSSDLPQTGSNSVGFRIVMNSAFVPPVLNFSRSGNTLTFSWTGTAKLQFQNMSLSGDWEDYPAGEISPVIHNIDPEIPAAFFRLFTP